MFNRKRDETFHHVVPREVAPRVERPPMPVQSMASQPLPSQPQDVIEIASRGSHFPLSSLGGNSVIGNDLVIEGDTITIRCKGSLKIDGHIRADLHCRQIEVGPDAVINGTIAAHEVSVEGRVHGAILAKTLVLRASAEVQGDIHSEFLSVEMGATFDGRSHRVTDPAEIAPQLEATMPTPGENAIAGGSNGHDPHARAAAFSGLQHS